MQNFLHPRIPFTQNSGYPPISRFLKGIFIAPSKPLLRQIVLLMLFLLGWASTAQAGTVSQTITLNFTLQPYSQSGILLIIGPPAASSSSGLPVSVSILTPSTCTFTTSYIVKTIAPGTCTIAANQAGDSTYSAAPQVTASTQVATPIAQTVSFHLPSTMQVGNVYVATASSSSGWPVSFMLGTFDISNICTITNVSTGVVQVTAVATGVCTIYAIQGGSPPTGTQPPPFYIASTVPQTIQVTQPVTNQTTSQTIGAITFSPTTLTIGGATTVSATATSGLGVSFSSLTPSICNLSGSTVYGYAAGACTIAANQAGNSSYSAATQVTQSIQVGQSSGANQIGAISFSPNTLAVGGSTTVSATATSGLAVIFSSTTPTICTVTGNTVKGAATGTCTIAANQPGHGNPYLQSTYVLPATQVTQSIQVGQSSSTNQIGAISFSPNTLAVGGNTTVSATATSGLVVSLSSTTPTICTVTGNTVKGIGAGTCTIEANQPGRGNPFLQSTYVPPAAQVTQSIQVGQSRVDCLFSWAERSYPQYFAPAAVTDATYAPYTYRYYSGTGNYLAVSSADNSVWVMGFAFGGLVDVGLVASFLGVSGCQ